MKMLIATPVHPDDETDFVDEWDMLMRDLRDDVERIADMPSYSDTQMSREEIYGTPAFVFRFEVDDDLGQQLLDSSYAECSDVVIEEDRS